MDPYDRLVQRGLAVKGSDNQHQLSDAGLEMAEEMRALQTLYGLKRLPQPGGVTAPADRGPLLPKPHPNPDPSPLSLPQSPEIPPPEPAA